MVLRLRHRREHGDEQRDYYDPGGRQWHGVIRPELSEQLPDGIGFEDVPNYVRGAPSIHARRGVI
ncbi:MAG TPA: hypothetical protein VFQ39_02010, partial [Longimicrobium sp.]|nr:hypothetical protein [Longimicrobium sp.]